MRYAFIASVALLASGPAFAGPPFRTDDPIPVDEGHWEIYLFSMATKTRGDMSGTLAGIDANYGAVPNLQLHTTIPLNFDAPSEAGLQLGSGDGEIGAKYRFLTEDEKDENGWRPQAAIYPAIDFSTGDASRNLGTGRTHVFLPLWVQKSFDPWVTFAGQNTASTQAREIATSGISDGRSSARSRTIFRSALSFFTRRRTRRPPLTKPGLMSALGMT